MKSFCEIVTKNIDCFFLLFSFLNIAQSSPIMVQRKTEIQGCFESLKWKGVSLYNQRKTQIFLQLYNQQDHNNIHALLVFWIRSTSINTLTYSMFPNLFIFQKDANETCLFHETFIETMHVASETYTLPLQSCPTNIYQ